MKLQHTLLAAALVAFAAPAFAAGDDADLQTWWDLHNLIYVEGDVDVYGTIYVSSESGAVVDQDQATVLNFGLGDGDNLATASGNALKGAKGNIGTNIAAGVGNAQANDGAFSAIDSGFVFASAQVFNSQIAGANVGSDWPSGPDNQLFYTAYATDNVLANAAGNIGLNIAAGVGNAQTNALAASVNTSGRLAKASADSEQLTLFNLLLANCDLDNTAYLNGMALSGAMGNIGVNIAAGVGNAQHNGLAIASASGGPALGPAPACTTCGNHGD